MGILDGKTILVAGVTLDTSIAFSVARIAQEQGATVIVSNFGRAMSLTRRVIRKLDPEPVLLEVDVTNEEHLAGLADQLRQHVDHLDGLVHSLAFANPETALGGKFLTTPWSDVSTALQVSAYSLASLTMACQASNSERIASSSASSSATRTMASAARVSASSTLATRRTLSCSAMVCWVPLSASLGKEASRASMRDRCISRNWRERTALPPLVHIEAARTT